MKIKARCGECLGERDLEDMRFCEVCGCWLCPDCQQPAGAVVLCSWCSKDRSEEEGRP